jgi:hypothetical protein
VDSVRIGVDVGQRVDPTAIAVCEQEGGRFVVRHLERLALGTPYPQVAKRISEVYMGVVARQVAGLYGDDHTDPARLADEYLGGGYPSSERRARDMVWLLIDATGVGTPVIDLIREEDQLKEAKVTGCFFTSGDRCDVRPGAEEASVGKGYLVSRLQALIQTKRIALPHTAEARALADELLNYEIRVAEDANLTAGAFKVGTHDDMVTALGLAVLCEEARYESGTWPYA